jgi:hypothetical protein
MLDFWNQRRGEFSWAEQGASSEIILKSVQRRRNTLGDDFL